MCTPMSVAGPAWNGMFAAEGSTDQWQIRSVFSHSLFSGCALFRRSAPSFGSQQTCSLSNLAHAGQQIAPLTVGLRCWESGSGVAEQLFLSRALSLSEKPAAGA